MMSSVVRALNWEGAAYDKTRSSTDDLRGGARKAIAKSWEEEGEDGVTMMAGRGDFSVARGRERSLGKYRAVRCQCKSLVAQNQPTKRCRYESIIQALRQAVNFET